MAKYDCEICRGQGTIRLPVYRRATIQVASGDPAAMIDESSRQYPCPECSATVPFARVGVIGAIKAFDTRIDDPRYVEHVKHTCIHSLIDQIISGGYVKVELGPPDSRELRQEIRVTLGVVSQKQVATLEERVAERQSDVAREVAIEASAQINNWGSYYGQSEIQKSDATRMVQDSIKTVLGRRAPWNSATSPLTNGE